MNIILISPELAMALGAILVLGLDLLMPLEASRRPLLYVSLLAVAVSASLSAFLASIGGTAFGGWLVADSYAVFFKLLLLALVALVVLASEDFIHRSGQYEAEFYALLLFATAGLMLMASTTELITIYLSLELSSLSLAFLAAWAKRDPKSGEAGLKFFLLSVMSTSVLLYGMGLLYGVTGVTNLQGIAQVLRSGASPAALLSLSMLVAGFGFKIAAVPFQMWTPDVYEGSPTPVTAFLSTASKAAGFAVVLRVFETALPGIQGDWVSLVGVLAALTMTVGNITALVQTNIKRLLAYSSITHVGYMLVGLAAASSDAISSILFYLVVYGATNLGAFTVVTIMSRFAPDETIASYAGLSRRAPWLSAALAFCLLSLAGLPPLAGFFSKLYLFWAAYQSGLLWLVLLGVVNSAVSLYYYARVIRQMYLAEPEREEPVRMGLAPALSLGASVLAVMAVGLVSAPFITAAQVATQVLVP